MASERARLLSKKSPAVQSRYASSSASRPEDQNIEDVQSIISHVSLDATPTYGRLIGSHILSLLPGLALLLATVMLAFHAPCHIHYEPEDRRSDRKLCRRLLSDWMSVTAFALGIISWLAAYSFRPAIWKVIEWSTLICQSWLSSPSDSEQETPSRPRQSPADVLSTVLFVLLRTIVLESIRIFNIIIINAVLFAGLAHLQGKQTTEQPHLHWLLHWYDPRFTVALWVGIGWAATEFVVSTFQMFDRLSLYKSSFEQATSDENANMTAAAANGQTPPASSFIDTHSPGDYLSDSAATVRAHSRHEVQSKIDPAQSELHKGSVENRSSLHLQAPENNTARDQLGSGFSMIDEAEEEEMKRLRQKLEEEIVQARMRDELQQTLGQPLTEVPVLLCALWRIDGLIWNLSTTLLLASSVANAQGPLDDMIPRLFPSLHDVQTTLIVLIGLHSIFTAAWTLLVGPLGFAFVTYTSMLAGLGLCVAAFWEWRLLI